jgi:hypothetical protein
MRDRKDLSHLVGVGISGALCGGLSGALIGYSLDTPWIGMVLGAIYLAGAEVWADMRRQPGQTKSVWHRVIGSTLMVAALAVLIDALTDNPVLTGVIVGLLIGTFGLGPRKLVTGILVGLAGGVLAGAAAADPNPALLGGGIALVYRLSLLVLFKDTEPLTIAGEYVSPSEARFVVPFEAHTEYIGAEYVKILAAETGGIFRRDQADIGIVESMDELQGPHFDPARVHPLIREFYEHTTRFRLAIVPEWNPFIKPLFWLFKMFVAQPIGQANLPFNTEEAQRGVVSYIDTIDYETPDATPVNIRTLRGWIRTFEATGEAIYVGIYTVVRHHDAGYVSVGFPLPESNFTATLLPYNYRQSDFLLKTRATGQTFTGHYVTFIEDGLLTILKLPTMDEEIDVFVQDGQLKTDHRFYLGNLRFLTLHYTIERKTA